MTKEEIYNQYAKGQGYESWDNLVNEKINEQRLSLYYDFKNVTDLIQEELLNKVTENVKNLLESEKVGEIFIEDYQLILKAILNTEIL